MAERPSRAPRGPSPTAAQVLTRGRAPRERTGTRAPKPGVLPGWPGLLEIVSLRRLFLPARG